MRTKSKFLIVFLLLSFVTTKGQESIYFIDSNNIVTQENNIANSDFKKSKSATATIAKSVEIVAGTLSSTLGLELQSITNLTVSGTIDARDFKVMRDSMPALTEIDLSNSTILAYYGTQGTYSTTSTDYAENKLPQKAFNKAVYGTSILTSVIMPSSINTIGIDAFNGCKNLTSIIIPPLVTKIERGVFLGCNGLTSVNIPALVSSLESSAFLSSALSSISVDINNPFYSSEDGVLYDKNKTTIIRSPSTKVGEFKIPISVSSIGNLAFYGNKGLTLIEIPSSVKSIVNQGINFCNCPILVNPDNLYFTSENGVLYNIEKTRLIYCPPYTSGSFTIPLSVSTIGVGAFGGCRSLTNIRIPSAVKSIESIAFSDCGGLVSLYVSSPIPIIFSQTSTVFYNINKTSCTLHVPAGAKSDYAVANAWKDFINITEDILDGLNETSENSATLFPNPAKNEITINNINQNTTIEIYDLCGRLLINKIANSSTEKVNVNNLSNGIYNMKLTNKNRIESVKFIKQ